MVVIITTDFYNFLKVQSVQIPRADLKDELSQSEHPQVACSPQENQNTIRTPVVPLSDYLPFPRYQHDLGF